MVQAEEFMLKQFQAADRELKGQIQPEESVKKCRQVIGGLHAETSGMLVTHNGDRTSWF